MIDLTDIKLLRNLLKKYRVWTKKRLGQHFLVNKKVLDKIIQVADLKAKENITEIGPGHGVLTQELLAKGCLVSAIEIDKDIIPVLKKITQNFKKNLEIFPQHILSYQQTKFPFKVIANIPYQLTSPLIRKFLVDTEVLPQKMVLLMQKEVAEKICHPKKNSVLSLFVSVFAKAEIVEIVGKDSFFPPPKVNSAILKISTFKKAKININKKKFFVMVKNGFSTPRKMLKNVLSGIFHKNSLEIEKIFLSLNIPPKARAENLTIKDWENLAEIFL